MEKGTKTYLPLAFREKMSRLLGDEADVFFQSYEEERKFGLRINPLKLETASENSALAEYLSGLRKIPWAEEGYYYPADLRPGRHPFHEAGAYYIQEPSAMAVAECLEPKPEEKILDLCAAPGGKTTHLAGKMGGKGLLVCNEIYPARAKILSQNVERMGVANAIVTNMDPMQMVPAFTGFFDGIVVDAPCSGEGMFRKDENARGEWSPDHVKQCAALQKEILNCAAAMLKTGGRMVYSTCTFSPEENEETVAGFLKEHRDFSLREPKLAGYFSHGHPEWADGNEELLKTIRIWPHLAEGEGHFLALFVKEEDNENGRERKTFEGKNKKNPKRGKGADRNDAKLTEAVRTFENFKKEALNGNFDAENGKNFTLFGDNLYVMPKEVPKLSGLKVLRPGLHLGTIKKDRMEPSHALALSLKKTEVVQSLEIGWEGTALKYLKGETLRAEDLADQKIPEKGWVLLTSGGIPIGFAKAAGGILKNHYPKGLRIQM